MEYTLQAVPTPMGHLSHTVTTSNSDFAHALYAQALDIDFEPGFAFKNKGKYEIEFISDTADCFSAIFTALMVVGGKA